MEKATEKRREALTLDAIDPKDGRQIVVMFSQEKLLAVAKRSKGQIKEAAYAVPIILQKPKAVFRGLLRETDEPKGEGDEGWLCYCGIPEIAYNEDGTPRAPWAGEVLMVFVSSEKVVYNWYWVKCDKNDPNLPEDHSVRFKERSL
jgi:hypothetical protein